MKAMNTVASHINEMQKIHEEFGAVFDLLISEQSGEKKEVCELYISSFQSTNFTGQAHITVFIAHHVPFQVSICH